MQYFGKLPDLQLEIDRSTTRFAMFLSRFLAAANAIGEGAGKMEKAVEMFERIMKVMGRVQSDQETGKLAALKPPKVLPAPWKQKWT